MTAAVSIVDIELSPVARQAAVLYIHDVHLDAGIKLAAGDDVRLRDEGGTPWDATVTAIEPVRLGRKYRLQLVTPMTAPTARTHL